MSVRLKSLRSLISVAATASVMATSILTIAAPAVTNAATNCVNEQGSTTVYPALVQAQAGFQGAVANPQPAWPTGQGLGCNATLVANGSGTGKSALINYFNGSSGTETDIAASSSPLNSTEANSLMAFQVGGDAMVIAVNVNAPISQITMGEVTAVFDGDYTNWNQLSGWTGTSLALVPRSRIVGSGTRDDMNRLFHMDRGVFDSTGNFTGCSNGFTTCEPTMVTASGQPRLTTSQDEANAVCQNSNQIVYTSLANLQAYGPSGANCLKALNLQFTDYTNFSSNLNSPWLLPNSGSFVAPSTTTAAVGGSYPAKRQLFLALPKVSVMASKYGTGNGTGWTDNLGLTKAMDIVDYMESTQGQTAMAAVGFIPISVPAKQPIPDADIDMNGGIGLTDIGQITGRWNQCNSALAGWVRADVDNSGCVGLTDIGKITGQWGATGFVAP
ncbi:MAG TPA: substrate-binding domain-containing protein [Candidatus Limnocylindrales bacterium]